MHLPLSSWAMPSSGKHYTDMHTPLGDGLVCIMGRRSSGRGHGAFGDGKARVSRGIYFLLPRHSLSAWTFCVSSLWLIFPWEG